MAFNVFAVPPISDDCERLFSSAKLLITDRRSRLNSDCIKACECLRQWYQIKTIAINKVEEEDDFMERMRAASAYNKEEDRDVLEDMALDIQKDWRAKPNPSGLTPKTFVDAGFASNSNTEASWSVSTSEATSETPTPTFTAEVTSETPTPTPTPTSTPEPVVNSVGNPGFEQFSGQSFPPWASTGGGQAYHIKSGGYFRDVGTGYAGLSYNAPPADAPGDGTRSPSLSQILSHLRTTSPYAFNFKYYVTSMSNVAWCTLTWTLESKQLYVRAFTPADLGTTNTFSAAPTSYLLVTDTGPQTLRVRLGCVGLNPTVPPYANFLIDDVVFI